MRDIIETELLDKIRQAMSDLSMSKTDFGKRVMGDPNFVFNLEAGRELRRATRKRVMDFIEGQNS